MSHKMKRLMGRRDRQAPVLAGCLTAGELLVLVVKWGLVKSDSLSPPIDQSRLKLRVFEQYPSGPSE